jgi:hypothetical protein
MRLAGLTNLTMGGETVVWADKTVGMHRPEDGDLEIIQDRHDAGRDVLMDVVQVSNIRLGMIDEALDVVLRLQRVDRLAKDSDCICNAPVLVELSIVHMRDEIVFVPKPRILRVSHAEENNLVPLQFV